MADDLSPDTEGRLRRLLASGREEDLGRLAVRRGLLAEAQLEEAMREAAAAPRSLAAVLAGRGWVRPEDWAALESAWEQEIFDRAALVRSQPLPAEVRPFLDDPARRMAEFVLVSRLGRGGLGEVWKAWDRRLGRWVALKRPVSPPDSRVERERFHREAAAVARLVHPSIVPVYRVSGPDESPFIAMQYVEGSGLEGVRLPLREALAAVRTAALAVDHAHRMGVIHRDLKPGNLLRDGRGAVWVLDFGLARLLEVPERLTAPGGAAGTPEYMAPEQARGEEAEAATDVYGLGATLYALLAGVPPFTGSSLAEIANRVAHDDPVPLRRLVPSLPADVATVVGKAMEKDPRLRYGGPAALAEDLRCLLEGEPIVARPLSAAGRLWRKAVRHRAVVVPVAAAAAVALAVSVWAGGAWLGRRARIAGVLAEARAQEAAGRMEAARDAYLVVAELDAGNDVARGGLARAEAGLKRTQAEAMSLLERARPVLEQASAALYDAAADPAAQREALGRALALIEQAVRLAPGLPLAHHRLGEAWERLGAWDRAEAAWRKAVELDPRFGPARYRLARALLARAYLASLDLWHDAAARPAAAGEALALEACREIEAAQAAGSGFDDDLQRQIAAALLAWFRRDRDAVRRTCRAALDHFGGRPGAEDLHWLLGLAAEPADDPRPAFDAALALRPAFPFALYARAAARLARSDFDGALADYDAAIRLVPDFAEAYVYRATVLYQKRDGPAALEAFGRVIERGLLLPAAYNGRGWTRLELIGDVDGAIADLSEAIRLMPEGYGLPYAARARAHFRKGMLDAADADCTRALALMPDWNDLRLIRARCRAARGDRAGAFEDLRAAGESAGGAVWKQIEEAAREAGTGG